MRHALKGLEGWMKVLELDHTVISPRDPASGLPTGKRQHKPLVVRIPLDKAGSLLINALVTNENLTSVFVSLPPIPTAPRVASATSVPMSGISALRSRKTLKGAILDLPIRQGDHPGVGRCSAGAGSPRRRGGGASTTGEGS